MIFPANTSRHEDIFFLASDMRICLNKFGQKIKFVWLVKDICLLKILQERRSTKNIYSKT